MVPIETPLTFSGFNNAALQHFGAIFNQLGITPCRGRRVVQHSTSRQTRRRTGRTLLNPGEAVAASWSPAT